MADNYLERRMEDLKAGRLKPTVTTHAGSVRKGYVEFPFPSRRVLVLGGVGGCDHEIMRAYLKVGCKVALFDSDREIGETLAYKEGIRYSNVDISDKIALGKAFGQLIEAWRDIDIVVDAVGYGCAETIAELWAVHRDKYPVPFGYRGRMILLQSNTYEMAGIAKEGNSNQSLAYLTPLLKPYGISVNAIVKAEDLPGEAISIGRLCLLLSTPGADFISGKLIPSH